MSSLAAFFFWGLYLAGRNGRMFSELMVVGTWRNLLLFSASHQSVIVSGELSCEINRGAGKPAHKK